MLHAIFVLISLLYTTITCTADSGSGCPERNFLSCVTLLRIQRVPFDKNMLNVVFSITSEAKLMHTCKAYADVLPCFRDKIVDCGNEKQKRLLDEVAKMLMFFCSPFSMKRQEEFMKYGQCIGNVLEMPASTSCLIEEHSLSSHIQACRTDCSAKREFICMMKIWISEQSLCTLIDVQKKCGEGAADFFLELQTNVFENKFPIICDLPDGFDPNAPIKTATPNSLRRPAGFDNYKDIYGPQIQPTKIPRDFDVPLTSTSTMLPNTTTSWTTAVTMTTTLPPTSPYKPFQYVTFKSRPNVSPPQFQYTKWYPAKAKPELLPKTVASNWPDEYGRYTTTVPNGVLQNVKSFSKNGQDSRIPPQKFINNNNNWPRNKVSPEFTRNNVSQNIVTVQIEPPVARPYRPYPRNPYFPQNYQSRVGANGRVWVSPDYYNRPDSLSNPFGSESINKFPPTSNISNSNDKVKTTNQRESMAVENNLIEDKPNRIPYSGFKEEPSSKGYQSNVDVTHGALFPLTKLKPQPSQPQDTQNSTVYTNSRPPTYFPSNANVINFETTTSSLLPLATVPHEQSQYAYITKPTNRFNNKFISNNSISPSLSAHPLPMDTIPWYLQSSRRGHNRPGLSKSRAPPRSSNVFPVPQFFTHINRIPDRNNQNKLKFDQPLEPLVPWFDSPQRTAEIVQNKPNSMAQYGTRNSVSAWQGDLPQRIAKDYYQMPMPAHSSAVQHYNKRLLKLLYFSMIWLIL